MTRWKDLTKKERKHVREMGARFKYDKTIIGPESALRLIKKWFNDDDAGTEAAADVLRSLSTWIIESKYELVARRGKLLQALRSTTGDTEGDHSRADEALLDFIDDTEVTEAFKAEPKWYA